MFVSSMSSEELCAEAMKDFSILQTKIDLFMDRCGKRYRQEHFIVADYREWLFAVDVVV